MSENQPMLQTVSHLGLAVQDLEATIKLYREVFGLELEERWVAETDQMEAAAFRVGEIKLELMQPLREDSPVGRFLARRGEGIHHVAYKVDNLDLALEQARAAGLQLVDEQPRPSGEGRTRVAFLHPKSTQGVLIELEEDVQPER